MLMMLMMKNNRICNINVLIKNGSGADPTFAWVSNGLSICYSSPLSIQDMYPRYIICILDTKSEYRIISDPKIHSKIVFFDYWSFDKL